jgi:hypothetical protein
VKVLKNFRDRRIFPFTLSKLSNRTFAGKLV